MKRKMTLSIALAVSVVLVSLMTSDSTAKAQNQIRCVADTGAITLGPNRILRIMVAGRGVDRLLTRFRRIEYAQGPCNGDGVCKHTIASQTISDPIALMPGEAASVDLLATTFGRGVVFSNSRDVQVNAQIIDAITGQVLATVWNVSDRCDGTLTG